MVNLIVKLMYNNIISLSTCLIKLVDYESLLYNYCYTIL